MSSFDETFAAISAIVDGELARQDAFVRIGELGEELSYERGKADHEAGMYLPVAELEANPAVQAKVAEHSQAIVDYVKMTCPKAAALLA